MINNKVNYDSEIIILLIAGILNRTMVIFMKIGKILQLTNPKIVFKSINLQFTVFYIPGFICRSCKKIVGSRLLNFCIYAKKK